MGTSNGAFQSRPGEPLEAQVRRANNSPRHQQYRRLFNNNPPANAPAVQVTQQAAAAAAKANPNSLAIAASWQPLISPSLEGNLEQVFTPPTQQLRKLSEIQDGYDVKAERKTTFAECFCALFACCKPQAQNDEQYSNLNGNPKKRR